MAEADPGQRAIIPGSTAIFPVVWPAHMMIKEYRLIKPLPAVLLHRRHFLSFFTQHSEPEHRHKTRQKQPIPTQTGSAVFGFDRSQNFLTAPAPGSTPPKRPNVVIIGRIPLAVHSYTRCKADAHEIGRLFPASRTLHSDLSLFLK